MANLNDFNIKFDAILREFNRVHSLTTYSDINAVANDSIDGWKFVQEFRADFMPRIAVDIGSGCGFPAIFLANILSDCAWHLFEPNGKKFAFLTYAKSALNLENIMLHKEFIQNATKFRADLISSRAVMDAPNLVKICAGFYDESSIFLLYKGSRAREEILGIKGAKIYSKNKRNYVIFEGQKC